MNQREYGKWLGEASLLLDMPEGCNGRWQRGQQIAADPCNIQRAVGGWMVASQSTEDRYHITLSRCNCMDGRAPIIGDVKWCKHRVAVVMWKLAHRLGARVAAILISEKDADGSRSPWQRQHWLVTDEGDNKQRNVYLVRRSENGNQHIEARCEVGGRVNCSHNSRTVCRHVRRCVERQAEGRSLAVSWLWDADNAVRLARTGGVLFRVASVQSQQVIYGLAKGEDVT